MGVMRLRLVLAAAAIGCVGTGAAGGESSGTTGSTASSTDPDASSTGSSSTTDVEATTADASSSTTGDGVPPAWDEDPPTPDCVADPRAPLLLDALAQADLTADAFGFSAADFAESSQHEAGVLGGDFVLSWFEDARARPIEAGCVEARTAAILDAYFATPHPVAGMLRRLAVTIDRPPDDASPIAAVAFDDALASLCTTVGSTCEGATLPDDLAAALAPVLAAIEEGIAARLAMDASPGGDPQFWWAN